MNAIKTLYARLVTKRHGEYATLRPGQTHPDVAQLRAALEWSGWPFVPVTVGQESTYDARLADVVGAFQLDAGLVPDRVVGKLTWGQLEAAEGEQPTHPRIFEGWVMRLNSLFVRSVWSRCGYYSNQASDSENARLPAGPMRLARASLTQRAAAWLLRNKSDSGLTCGHLQEFVATLLLLPGNHLEFLEARWCASGMNLGGTWEHRAPWLNGRRSSATCACIEGLATWQEKKWKPEVRGYAREGGSGIRRWEPGIWSPYTIVEFGSHVIGKLHCSGKDGILDPRTGLLLPAGDYRVAADGGEASPGRPWTFRAWRESDNLDAKKNPAINRWSVFPMGGPEVGLLVRAYLEV